MAQENYRPITELIVRAAELARSVGIPNLLQPGLAKEMIIADLLGHTLITSKRDADAHAPDNPDERYEYLSCKEGGNGQFDRMFKEPSEDRVQSMWRVTRNKTIFLAVFYASNQTKCKTIYALDPSVVAAEVERKLDRSANRISHVGIPIGWAKQNGRVVYEDQASN